MVPSIAACDDGFYGVNCSKQCSGTCVGVCDKATGHCSLCQVGWRGTYCDQGNTRGLRMRAEAVLKVKLPLVLNVR